eukprot:ctg_256.g147
MVLADESRFADWQTVKLQELPEAVPTGEVPRSLLLTLDRHLVDQVTPGERISAVGIFSTYAGYAARSGSGARAVVAGADALVAAVRAPYLRVVGVRPAEDRRDRHPTFTPEEEEEMARFSRLPHLYETLARSMAPELWGLDDPKRAILCQLFGGSRKHLPDGMRLRGDINVLLLGDPSTAKSQLLKFTERVAPVSVYTSGKGSSGAGLTASVIRDAASGEFHLEGGAMVLADGGVVCIDEFDKMRVADRVAIHEAMEQQTISIAKAGITTVLNSRAAVLAAANPLFGSFDDARGAAEQIDFASTILSRFDLIFVIKDVRDDERDRTIAQHVLALHQRVNRLRLQSSPGGSLDDASDAFTPTDAVLAGAASTGASMLNADGLVPLDKLRRYIAYRRRRRPGAGAHHGAPVGVDGAPHRALAKMRLSSTATAADAEEALRLFRVATIAASRSGAVPAGALEGGLSSEFLLEVQAAEASIRRRLTIGALLSEQRLLQDLARHHLSTAAIHKALQFPALVRCRGVLVGNAGPLPGSTAPAGVIGSQATASSGQHLRPGGLGVGESAPVPGRARGVPLGRGARPPRVRLRFQARSGHWGVLCGAGLCAQRGAAADAGLRSGGGECGRSAAAVAAVVWRVSRRCVPPAGPQLQYVHGGGGVGADRAGVAGVGQSHRTVCRRVPVPAARVDGAAAERAAGAHADSGVEERVVAEEEQEQREQWMRALGEEPPRGASNEERSAERRAAVSAGERDALVWDRVRL